jgi:hypothetical protein
VYGQVLISLLPLYTDERFVVEERSDSSSWINTLLKKIEMVIDEPDAGLWEFRDIAGHFCYTYLFQWAGCQAAIRLPGVSKIKSWSVRRGGCSIKL